MPSGPAPLGYLLKGTPRVGLIKAIEGTATGQTYIDPAVARQTIYPRGRDNCRT